MRGEGGNEMVPLFIKQLPLPIPPLKRTFFLSSSPVFLNYSYLIERKQNMDALKELTWLDPVHFSFIFADNSMGAEDGSRATGQHISPTPGQGSQ